MPLPTKTIQFFVKIVIQIWRSFFLKTTDNHDFSRFPEIKNNSGMLLKFYKKIRRCIRWTIETSYFFINIRKFYKSYELLCDLDSKELFIRLIVYKILGPKHIKIKNNCDWNNEKEFLCEIEQFYIAPSELIFKPHPLFGGLNHYQNIPTESGKISLDCWAGGVIYPAIKKQYYFQRNGITVQPESGDVVIDGGGCFGDTSVFFAKSVGTEGKVYVFDPLPIHGVIIHKNILQNSLNNQVTYMAAAIGEYSNSIKQIENFNHGINPGFRLLHNSDFPITSIDDFMENHGVNKINFIKMDIEGYELLALKGAAKTIRKFKPKLAISIYHKREDFYTIPLWINKISDDYNYYIDHYTIHAEETVLYAIPK